MVVVVVCERASLADAWLAVIGGGEMFAPRQAARCGCLGALGGLDS